MIHKFSLLLDIPVELKDGHAGVIHDLYFDEDTGCIRYIVINTSSWLFGKHVLLSPVVCSLENEVCHASLFRAELEASPNHCSHLPVYLEEQKKTYSACIVPPDLFTNIGNYTISQPQHDTMKTGEQENNKSKLRSVKEVLSYTALWMQQPQHIGQTIDIEINGSEWVIDCFIVKNSSHSPHCIRVTIDKIEKFDYDNSSIYLQMSLESFSRFIHT